MNEKTRTSTNSFDNYWKWSLVFVLFMSTSFIPAKSKSSHNLLSSISAPQQMDMSLETTVDGQDFIDDMKSVADSYNTYSFQYEMTAFKGKKTIDEKGNFYFKKPRLMRVEEIGTYKKGAVAVIDKDGKIRGHLGGALAPFVMTLQKDSDMLRSANGYSLVDSDFSSLAKVMQNFVKQQNMQSKLSERPVAVDDLNTKVYVLELYKGPKHAELFKRTYVDPKTLLPLEWFDYDNGQLLSRTIWKNLQLNPTLKDDLFNI